MADDRDRCPTCHLFDRLTEEPDGRFFRCSDRWHDSPPPGAPTPKLCAHQQPLASGFCPDCETDVSLKMPAQPFEGIIICTCYDVLRRLVNMSAKARDRSITVSNLMLHMELGRAEESHQRCLNQARAVGVAEGRRSMAREVNRMLYEKHMTTETPLWSIGKFQEWLEARAGEEKKG